MVGLVGALDRDADVSGLVPSELRELDPERVQVEPGHLLVELLGQDLSKRPMLPTMELCFIRAM
jgi:hypothetical protein